MKDELNIEGTWTVTLIIRRAEMDSDAKPAVVPANQVAPVTTPGPLAAAAVDSLWSKKQAAEFMRCSLRTVKIWCDTNSCHTIGLTDDT